MDFGSPPCSPQTPSEMSERTTRPFSTAIRMSAPTPSGTAPCSSRATSPLTRCLGSPRPSRADAAYEYPPPRPPPARSAATPEEAARAGARIARERDARRAGLPQIAEHHGLDVHRRVTRERRSCASRTHARRLRQIVKARRRPSTEILAEVLVRERRSLVHLATVESPEPLPLHPATSKHPASADCRRYLVGIMESSLSMGADGASVNRIRFDGLRPARARVHHFIRRLERSPRRRPS
jgi:hypothetical protein